MQPQHSGVFVIVINKNKEFLIGKRKNCYKAGMFGFPGGRLELNETIMECGIRELYEETGITIKSLKYIGVVRELQTGYNFIHFGFVCEDCNELPKLTEPDKCEGWKFYPLSNIPDKLLPGHKAGLDLFFNKDEVNYKDLVK